MNFLEGAAAVLGIGALSLGSARNVGRTGRAWEIAALGYNPAQLLDTWSDERLLDHCRDGDEAAWSALIHRYKNLIYSIPIRYGFSRDDASDIFQQVSLRMLEALPGLRDPKRLPAWLITVTANTCSHWLKRERPYQPMDSLQGEPFATASDTLPEAILGEIEDEQMVRAALLAVPQRCKELIEMLFLEYPPVPYEQVAARLGLAKGSIGFVRMRCLKRLRRALEEKLAR